MLSYQMNNYVRLFLNYKLCVNLRNLKKNSRFRRFTHIFDLIYAAIAVDDRERILPIHELQPRQSRRELFYYRSAAGEKI